MADYIIVSSRPSDYGIPFPGWREHQGETFEKIVNSGTRYTILESPTGSGKSAHAVGLGHFDKVLVLVATLGLLDQYAKDYDFAVVKGRQEYLCADPNKRARWMSDFGILPTAADCHVSPPWNCHYVMSCPYIVARERAKNAKRTAVTYRYASLAPWVLERDGILVCDECHETAEEILSLGNFALTQHHVKKYGIDDMLNTFTWRIEEPLDSPRLFNRVDAYLEKCVSLTRHFARSAMRGDESKETVAGFLFHRRLTSALERLRMDGSSWFLEAGKRAVSGNPGILIRPLDARPVASMLWENKKRVLLMSATIGEPDPLAHELGIEDYEYIETPHLIPADKRPVDVIYREKMTKRNRDRHPGVYKGQALAISHWINSLPADWRGIILTSSYHKIKMLREHLNLNGRIWTAPEECGSVGERVEAFMNDPTPGIVAVDTIQGWGHGLDLRGDLGRFVVVAGVSFSNPADPYDRARRSRPGGSKYQWWLSYTGVVQAPGRVSRGTKDENGEYILNCAALADGSTITRTALSYYPEWFKDALRY